MRQVPVGNGAVAYVDEKDYQMVQGHRWYSLLGYAATRIKGRQTLMHRLILNPPADKYVDHINGDRLDNRRANLRIVTNSQNQQNRLGPSIRSKTGVRGVRLNPDPRGKRFRAEVGVNNQSIHVGYFDRLEDAATAVAQARRHHMTHSVENREDRSVT